LKFFHVVKNIWSLRSEWEDELTIDGHSADVPFNSTIKFAFYIKKEKSSGRKFLFMKGAPERIWKRCNNVLKNGSADPMSEEW
jgi:sodium/potassium-transporting ATPase subunit alpha